MTKGEKRAAAHESCSAATGQEAKAHMARIESLSSDLEAARAKAHVVFEAATAPARAVFRAAIAPEADSYDMARARSEVIFWTACVRILEALQAELAAIDAEEER